MTGEGERRTGTLSEADERERTGEREASKGGERAPPGERGSARPEAERDPSRDAAGVPEPSPEEAPELLGERSDYPIAWDDEEH